MSFLSYLCFHIPLKVANLWLKVKESCWQRKVGVTGNTFPLDKNQARIKVWQSALWMEICANYKFIQMIHGHSNRVKVVQLKLKSRKTTKSEVEMLKFNPPLTARSMSTSWSCFSYHELYFKLFKSNISYKVHTDNSLSVILTCFQLNL